MIFNLLKRRENPGIIDVHALETFTQTLTESGLSARQWKAKTAGYIYVTIEKTAGLCMEANCWQFLKQIPLIKKILNYYIRHDVWEAFLGNVDREPEIRLVEKESTKGKMITDTEVKPNEPSLLTLIETVTEAVEEKLEEGKEQVVEALEKTVAAVRTVVKGCRTVYAIPYKLYKALVKQHRKKEGDNAKPMSVQSALHQLKTLAKKAVDGCRT